MKKLIISALALILGAGVMNAQDPKEVKAQQKTISTILKEAEKLGKVAEDAMGQVDQSKKPDFAGARKQIAAALANPFANTMLGDINRTAGDIEFNAQRFATKGAGEGDQAALAEYLDACGAGFKYYDAAWKAYATPDEKGKANTKFNDKIAANAAQLFLNSSGLYNCGLLAYQADNFEKAAEYWTLAGDGIETAMIKHAAAKNPLVAANLESYQNDSARFQSKLYAASAMSKVDHKKAIKSYESLLGAGREQTAVYSGIIAEYAEMQDTTSMIAWLEKAIDAMPEQGIFANSLFYIYLDKQDYDGAISSLQKSLNANPNNVAAITLIARLYTQQDKTKEAAEYYQKALAVEPNSLDANLYYGVNFLREQELGESELLKNHARDAEIDKFSNEKFDAALPYLRKAFALDTEHNDSNIPTLLMQVLYRKFQPTNAQNKAALIEEYNTVADAYGRPGYHR